MWFYSFFSLVSNYTFITLFMVNVPINFQELIWLGLKVINLLVIHTCICIYIYTIACENEFWCFYLIFLDPLCIILVANLCLEKLKTWGVTRRRTLLPVSAVPATGAYFCSSHRHPYPPAPVDLLTTGVPYHFVAIKDNVLHSIRTLCFPGRRHPDVLPARSNIAHYIVIIIRALLCPWRSPYMPLMRFSLPYQWKVELFAEIARGKIFFSFNFWYIFLAKHAKILKANECQKEQKYTTKVL